METKRRLLSILVMATCIGGCSDVSLPWGSETGNTTADPAVAIKVPSEKTVPSVKAADQRTVVDSVTRTAGRSEPARRIGQLLENVMPTLEQARQLVDQHADLPDDSSIPFRTDKRSNSAAINELLDQAIETLAVSEVSDYRLRIRQANEAIAGSQELIADYRRQRISAAWAKDQTQLERVNPFELSKEAIDERIAAERKEIESQRQRVSQLEQRFQTELEKIGVHVDDGGVEALLSSVSGDDIVTMAVVFDNIKQLTTQLQRLTDQSGEALDTSKRYYGMYVVMVHVMDRIQKTFIRDIEQKHIPKLNEFADKADQNIQQARTLISVDGGDVEVLEANIESNQLTRQTAQLYVEYLKQNAKLIARENKRARKNLATAMNTYDTVKLSSDVAALMNSGRRDFETLMRLRVPSLREFGNKAIRREFERMTLELRGDT